MQRVNFFPGILESVESLPDVVEVLHPFSCPGLQCVVDVVCNQGYSWVKVIARNAQALHLRWAGQFFFFYHDSGNSCENRCQGFVYPETGN